MSNLRRCTLALAFVAAICVTSTHAAGSFTGHMELRSNVEGFPLAGYLSFFDDRSLGGEMKVQLKWRDDAAVPPGIYYGYAHDRNDFTHGCNSTGQFVAYQTKDSGRALLRAANIIVSDPSDAFPSVEFYEDITLEAGVNSIMNNVIVFHNSRVLPLLSDRLEQLAPGLHQTSAFCGFVHPKCIPRDEL